MGHIYDALKYKPVFTMIMQQNHSSGFLN